MLRLAIRKLLSRVRNAHADDYNAMHVKRAASYCDPEGSRILVVGCNRGGDCRHFIELGAAEVHGLDVIEDVGCDFQHGRAAYHRMSAEDMGLPSDYYDLVYCFATMEHIPRIDAAFREMARVTRPGGYVYCVASPLWNSRNGHHKRDLFPDDPWIHLRMTKDEIVAHGTARGVNPAPGLVHHVSFMLNEKYFNKVPARRYVEVCESLPNMTPVLNSLDREPEDAIPAGILVELSAKGYTSEELRAVTHTYVGKKIA